MKKQTAEDVENIPVWPINVLVLLISVERNNVYSVRNQVFDEYKFLTYILYRIQILFERTMKKQTAEDVENIPVWPINVLVLLISVERNNVYSVRNHTH